MELILHDTCCRFRYFLAIVYIQWLIFGVWRHFIFVCYVSQGNKLTVLPENLIASWILLSELNAGK